MLFRSAQLASLPIKAAKDRKLIGSETQALDIPSKTNGAAIYGIDATFEGMVYAKPIVPPTRYGASVKSVDDSQAKNVKGYQQTLVLDDPSDCARLGASDCRFLSCGPACRAFD